MNELKRIDQLENQQAAIQLVLEAHDATHVALVARYEEQKAALDEAGHAAEESAREILGLKDAVSNLVTANGHLSNRIDALSDRLHAVAAGGSDNP